MTNLAEVGSSRSQTRKRKETHVAEGARGVCGQWRGEAAQPADRVRGAAGRSSLPFLWVGHTLVPLALMAPSTRSTGARTKRLPGALGWAVVKR